MVRRNLALCLVILGLIAVTCSSSSDSPTEATATNTVTKATMAEPANDTAPTPGSTPSRPRVAANIDPASIPSGQVRYFGPAPKVPTGDLAPATAKAIDTLLGEQLLRFVINQDSFDAISTLGQSEDPRVAWWLADLMRIAPDPDLTVRLSSALHELLGVEIDPLRPWDFTTNHLMGWDIPAPPDYLTYKRNTYIVREPKWEPLFEDGSDIDWRLISWGGVFIDDRAFNMTDNRCNCIPAADNPITTSASGGDELLDEDAVIFGISINGEHRAYPRSIMEVREMVNDTLGGRDFAMPYCTLCGSAQVFFTDEVPAGFARPVLRTSGLLNRSNKVMFDVTTFSIFDTFLGRAVSGPLGDAGVELNQHSVITTTWGRWKTDHPDTTVLDISLALGREDSDLRNTRDANGPIFPIGQVDPRLPEHEDVLGLVKADGTAIAFHVTSAIEALERGEFIELDGINVILAGGGLQAVDAEGNDLGGHQAFWFAWSQFHPNSKLWPL